MSNCSEPESKEIKEPDKQQPCDRCKHFETELRISRIKIVELMKKCSESASEITALNKSLHYYKSLFDNNLSNATNVMVDERNLPSTHQVKTESTEQIKLEPIDNTFLEPVFPDHLSDDPVLKRKKLSNYFKQTNIILRNIFLFSIPMWYV